MMGRSLSGVWVQVTEIKKASVVSDPWRPLPDRLQDHERETIAVCLGRGESLTSIAGQLGRSPSTISREVAVNGGRQHYRAFDAHQRARRCARRPKVAKLEHGPLAEQVTAWLEELWSPKEISGRLTREHPNDPDLHSSHETISQSLFVQGREELRRELARFLRSRRNPAQEPRSRRDEKSHQGQSHDLGAPSCGRGSSGPEPLGGRPRHGSWLVTLSSASPLASRSASVIRTHLGSEGRTRTPTDCSATIYPRGQTCRNRQLRTWSASSGA